MPLGGLVTVFLFLPNLLYLIYPPQERPEPEEADKSRFAKFLALIERAGQIACFVLPFFYPINFNRPLSWIALCVMVISLLFYYAGWARYMQKGRRFGLLFEPMAGIPLPMAVAPVIYLAGAALLLGSWPTARRRLPPGNRASDGQPGRVSAHALELSSLEPIVKLIL